MANAIKKISVQRGYDVTRYALNCFGGAGGQHACLVADALGMTKVLIHPFSSLLSAYGMGLANIRATREQALEQDFGEQARQAIAASGAKLGADAKRELMRQGVSEQEIKVQVRAHIRYAGTDTPLVVEAGPLGNNEDRVRARPQGAVRLYRCNQIAGGRGCLGRGDRRRREIRRADARDNRGRLCLRRRAKHGSIPAAPGTMPAYSPATNSCPATASMDPRSSSNRTRPSWSKPAGAPRSPREPPRARTGLTDRAHARDRH